LDRSVNHQHERRFGDDHLFEMKAGSGEKLRKFFS